MNDITVLMASMKAAAEKATEAHERLSAMPSDGLFDASLAENAQLESDITALIAHNDASTPANVRALVGALEKAQSERDELQHGFIANQEEAREAIKYATELKEQIAELVADRMSLLRTMGVYVHAYEEAKGQVAKDVEIKARLCRESNSLFDRLRAAEKRIAELESRTVTVNPYPLATDKSQGWTIHPDFLHQIRERIGDDAENYDFSPSMEMVESVLLAAAGIQVIEGEGQ